MERPPQLENVLYVDWAQKYMLDRFRSSLFSRVQDDDESGDDEAPGANQPMVDMAGRRWKRQNVEAVARWRFYLPNGDNQEDYYM